MTDIATHVRIFDSDPADDLVVKRAAAIKELASRYRKGRPVAAILQAANDIAAAVEARGKVSDTMSKEVESAVRNGGADAFVAAGKDLEVKVCALLAALEVLESAPPTTGDVDSATVLGIGLWLGLSFQAPVTEPKLEKLRTDLLEVAHQHVVRSATSSRQRLKVPDLNVAAAAEPFDAANVAKSVNSGVRAAFNALRTNAAVDREEIDLLWWVLNDWSTLLDRRYSEVTNSITAAVSSGIEAGQMLRRLPGDAHRNLVLRHVRQGESSSLGDVVTSLGDDRILLAKAFANQPVIAACPAVFPLLGTLISGSATHHRSKQKRPVSEWAARALLETAANHVTALLPAVTN
jgi:hypothetical protein